MHRLNANVNMGENWVVIEKITIRGSNWFQINLSNGLIRKSIASDALLVSWETVPGFSVICDDSNWIQLQKHAVYWKCITLNNKLVLFLSSQYTYSKTKECKQCDLFLL